MEKRLKKIFAPLICYFILTAFVSCITCGFLLNSQTQQQKAERISVKKTDNPDLPFLFEDEDSDDDSEIGFSNHSTLLNKNILDFHQSYKHDKGTDVHSFSEVTKTPLFIQIRKLRI